MNRQRGAVAATVLWSLLPYAISAITVVLAGWYLWKQVDGWCNGACETARKATAAANEALTKAQASHVLCQGQLTTARAANASLLADLKNLDDRVAKLNESVDAMREADAKAKATKSRELQAVLAREASLRDELARLAAIAAGPPAPTREESCDAADRLLGDVFADRVRQ